MCRTRIGRSLAAAFVALASIAARADYLTALDAWNQGDYPTALREWLVLAEHGDAESQFRVARMYHHGEAGHDDAQALRWYRRAAEQGHEGAQNNLGLLYEEGRGVTRDPAEAARWYARAADHGLVAAQANLARLYDLGLGVAADPAEAARWYKRAADGGHTEAQYRLGQLYEQGRGVPQDAKKAASWYRKASRHGNLAALDALARATPQPPPAQEAQLTELTVTAPAAPRATAAPVARPAPTPGAPSTEVDPLRGSAEAGDAEAQYRLALRYETGQGVPRSLPEAARWLLEAARQGHPMSAYRLALMHLRGLGPSERKDYVQAHRWFSLAAARGLGDAADWRDRLAQKMTEQELAESAKLQGKDR